ncbi:hypothetical protein HY621_02490 [Candidatus Uhrbacteria bacterium]|nr:hypothetical protein [Candidatus Uhrbacteria bacterium]
MKNESKKQGSVLIMTIIIASGIMIVSAEFALFVVGAIRHARTIDHATIAYYAAESGAESGLFQIRRESRNALRKTKSSEGEFPLGMKWTLENEGATVRFRNSIDTLARSLMKKNETSEFALYNNVVQGLSGIENLESLKITWTHETNCGDVEGQRPWFEISVIEWEGGQVDWNNVWVKKAFLEATGITTQAIFKFSDVRESKTEYRPMLLRVKPLFCDVAGVQMTLHTDDAGTSDPPLPIPNYFFLAPQGMFSTISQKAQIIFPAKESAMGLFDFTLFSEEQVKKSD